MKAGPSLHDFLRLFQVFLEMSASLSAESSAVKNLFGRRVTRVHETFPKTPDSTDHQSLLCGVFKKCGDTRTTCNLRRSVEFYVSGSDGCFFRSTQREKIRRKRIHLG